MTIAVHPSALNYWQARIDAIVRGAGAAGEGDDLAVYTVESKSTAIATLDRGARAAGWRTAEYRAGHYTRFVPGKLPIVVDERAGWAALCTVTADGRLGTVEDVAVWR